MLIEENLAFNQPAWATVNTYDPAFHAVDNDLDSFAYTGIVARPFVGVDLGGIVVIGRVSIFFGWSKYGHAICGM